MKYLDYYQIIETGVEIVHTDSQYDYDGFITSSYMLPWFYRCDFNKIEHAVDADEFNSWERYMISFNCEFKALELKSIYELRLL